MYRALVHILQVPKGTEVSTTLYYNHHCTTTTTLLTLYIPSWANESSLEISPPSIIDGVDLLIRNAAINSTTFNIHFLFLYIVCFYSNVIYAYYVDTGCRVPLCPPFLAALSAVERGCPAHTALATNTDTPMAENSHNTSHISKHGHGQRGHDHGHSFCCYCVGVG